VSFFIKFTVAFMGLSINWPMSHPLNKLLVSRERLGSAVLVSLCVNH